MGMEDVGKRLAEVRHYREGRDEERLDVVSFLRRASKKVKNGEILMLAAQMIENGDHKDPAPITKEEFIEEMRLSVDRSRSRAVFGYETLEDAAESAGPPPHDYDRSAIMISETMGVMTIDDLNAPRTRKGGTTSTPLYELEQPQMWPKGLFERMIGMVWIIDRPIDPLDSIAMKV